MTPSTIGPIANGNGDFTNDDEQTCSILNTFFASVFTVEDLRDISSVPAVDLHNNNVLRSINITESDVSKCIDKLKLTSHQGLILSHPVSFKKAKCEFVKPLTLIFNESLQSGSMPDDWKLANVTPI